MENKKARGFGKVLRGVVSSNKMTQTVTVKVIDTVRHPDYKKFMKRTKKYHAHDEKNSCQIGDVVLIKESAPISKTKKWVVTKLVEAHKE